MHTDILFIILIIIRFSNASTECKCEEKCTHNCLKIIPNSTCTYSTSNCPCTMVYKDNYGQSMDCEYESLTINLSNVTKVFTPVFLHCNDRNMDVIISSAVFKDGPGLPDNNVTIEMRQICSMKRFCVYPIYTYKKCQKNKSSCYKELFIEYFCKINTKERSKCDSACFNDAKCEECHTDATMLTEPTCHLCKCLHEPQVIFPNKTINRYCQYDISGKSSISTAGIIAAVIFGVIICGAFFSLVVISLFYVHRRRKYKNYSTEQLLSFPLESELI